MSDPIQLVSGIYKSAGLQPSAPTSKVSGQGSGSASSQPQQQDYTLSEGLSNILSEGKSVGLSGSALAAYNASTLAAQSRSQLVSDLPGSGSDQAALLGQVGLYRQYSTAVRALQGAAQASAAKGADPMGGILSDAHANGTNAPALSDQAKAILAEGKTASANAALATTDPELSRIVGISQSIQGG